MSFESDLYSYLSAHADASALRAIIGTRIYWMTTPQHPTLPYIQITTVSGDPGKVLSGADGHDEARLQFSIFGATPTVCISIRDALRDLLHANKRFTEGSTVFQSILMQERGEVEISDPEGNYLHRPVDFDFIHSTT